MFSLKFNGKLLQFDTPKVMGIVNVTPNSFYENSRQQTIDTALKKVEQLKMLLNPIVTIIFLPLNYKCLMANNGN